MPRPASPEPADTLRQNGTAANVPFRHVRLTAAFTAQLLGQILPDPERPLTGAAYGRTGAGIVGALDALL